MPQRSNLTQWVRDFALTTTVLTRVPLDRSGAAPPDGLARAAWAMPLVGIAVGLAGGLAYALGFGLGLPPALCALVALAATAFLTGALHEDGLADTFDGLGGGRDRTHKLSIMRASNIGTYGVLALLFSLGFRAGALTTIFEVGAVVIALIGAHALARAVLPSVMAALPLAREDGLAAGFGRVEPRRAAIGLALGGGIAWLALGFSAAVIGLFVACVAALLVAWIAKAQIGGYSGDILGAAEQAAECAVLLSLVALL
jgi:adenosylcobinamide-GDP ribazoletransferase